MCLDNRLRCVRACMCARVCVRARVFVCTGAVCVYTSGPVQVCFIDRDKVILPDYRINMCRKLLVHCVRCHTFV
jgi:hypothetical protein